MPSRLIFLLSVGTRFRIVPLFFNGGRNFPSRPHEKFSTHSTIVTIQSHGTDSSKIQYRLNRTMSPLCFVLSLATIPERRTQAAAITSLTSKVQTACYWIRYYKDRSLAPIIVCVCVRKRCRIGISFSVVGSPQPAPHTLSEKNLGLSASS